MDCRTFDTMVMEMQNNCSTCMARTDDLQKCKGEGYLAGKTRHGTTLVSILATSLLDVES